MKSEALFRALGDVGDDLIERAGKSRRKAANTWAKWGALAACCALILGIAVLSLPQWGAKSDAPMAADQARATADMPAAAAAEAAPEMALEEAPAEAAPAPEAQAEETMEAPAEGSPAGDAPAAVADAFEGRSERAVSFMYYVYEPAADNDPAHTAGESDGDLRGDRIGAVENSLSEGLMGAEVYAYDSYDTNKYILVRDESRDDPWVLYRSVQSRDEGPTFEITASASGQSAVLSDEDADVILDILDQGEWIGELSVCEPDCILVTPEGRLSYHSECGAFNDGENGRSLLTDGDTRQTINAILEQYVTLGY